MSLPATVESSNDKWFDQLNVNDLVGSLLTVKLVHGSDVVVRVLIGGVCYTTATSIPGKLNKDKSGLPNSFKQLL